MRLLTWNIHGGVGLDGRRSLARLAEVIRESRADVACLQEVHQRLPQSGFEDQPRRLAGQVGMRAVFWPSFRMGVGGFGNAVLTRVPVEGVRFHRLPNPEERRRRWMWLEWRGCLEVRLADAAGLLTVMVTHWSLDVRDRLEGAAALAGVLAGVDGPVLVAGDLNARPQSEEVRALIRGGGLNDAGEEAGPTFPVGAPAARIDYVLTRGVDVRSAEVLPSEASDHLPLVVEWSSQRYST